MRTWENSTYGARYARNEARIERLLSDEVAHLKTYPEAFENALLKEFGDRQCAEVCKIVTLAARGMHKQAQGLANDLIHSLASGIVEGA